MDSIEIVGGGSLSGSVRISGAKNAALPIMTAALLADGEHVFRNVPNLRDVHTMTRLLGQLGVKASYRDGRVHVTASGDIEPTAPYDLVKQMRASVLVLGPLVARCGRAMVSLPGGCAIGARPIDQHLKGLEAMGADVELHHGYVREAASSSPRAVLWTVFAAAALALAASVLGGWLGADSTRRIHLELRSRTS